MTRTETRLDDLTIQLYEFEQQLNQCIAESLRLTQENIHLRARVEHLERALKAGVTP